MTRKTGKKRMTLSEHLALRAQMAEESRMREEVRAQSIRALRELDAQATCNCPDCVKLRTMKEANSDPRA